MIFPQRVFGSAVRMSISEGVATGPRSWRTWSFSDAMSPGPCFTPARTTTKALMRSPCTASGSPTTALSPTAGWRSSDDSTSAVPIRCPATFITSSARPSTAK